MPSRHTTSRGLNRSVEHFVGALRRLHERAGEPSFREMGLRAHYSASALCRAVSGSVVPTYEATMAFVRACDGDRDLWVRQHRTLRHAVQAGKVVEFVPWEDVHDHLPVRTVNGGARPAEQPELLVAHLSAHGAADDARRLDWEEESRIVFAKRVAQEMGRQERLSRGQRRQLAVWMQFVGHMHQPGQFALQMRVVRRAAGLTLREVSERTGQEHIRAVTGRDRIPVSTLSDLCSPRHDRLPTPETLHGFLLAVEAPPEVVNLWLHTLRVLLLGRETRETPLSASIAQALNIAFDLTARDADELMESPFGLLAGRIFMHMVGSLLLTGRGLPFLTAGEGLHMRREDFSHFICRNRPADRSTGSPWCPPS